MPIGARQQGRGDARRRRERRVLTKFAVTRAQLARLGPDPDPRAPQPVRLPQQLAVKRAQCPPGRAVGACFGWQ